MFIRMPNILRIYGTLDQSGGKRLPYSSYRVTVLCEEWNFAERIQVLVKTHHDHENNN